MHLEQRDKELAAIGASVGCNCRPCAEHHIPAGREAGLMPAPRIDELLVSGGVPVEPAPVAVTSPAEALASLGASVGANSHALLGRHIAAALALGLSAGEITAAARMAGYVQKRASEMTADKATHTLEELGGVACGAAPGADHRTPHTT